MTYRADRLTAILQGVPCSLCQKEAHNHCARINTDKYGRQTFMSGLWCWSSGYGQYTANPIRDHQPKKTENRTMEEFNLNTVTGRVYAERLTEEMVRDYGLFLHGTDEAKVAAFGPVGPGQRPPEWRPPLPRGVTALEHGGFELDCGGGKDPVRVSIDQYIINHGEHDREAMDAVDFEKKFRPRFERLAADEHEAQGGTKALSQSTGGADVGRPLSDLGIPGDGAGSAESK